MSALAGDTTARDIRHTTEVVRAVADLPEEHARFLAVLTYRMGAVGSALARGEVEQLAEALRHLDAGALTWLGQLERERTRGQKREAS